MIKNVLIMLAALVFTTHAWALDRVQLIQAKIHTSLSAILPRSDFLVVVNRLDTLEDGGASQVVDGSVRMLPGLNLGVDSKGDLIRQDSAGNDYFGAVSIRVIVDQNVKAETYKTLQSLLPEIVGGLRDDDEVNLSQGTLRQPPVPDASAPQVSIQNNPNNQNQFQENLKFLAVLVIATGIMVWLLSRMSSGQKQVDGKSPSGHANSSNKEEKSKDLDFKPSAFNEFEPEAVALFFLRQIKDKDLSPWTQWRKYAPAQHQRSVLSHLPPWILSYIHSLSTNLGPNGSTASAQPLDLQGLFNEIALVEQSFRGKLQKDQAFLKWFPAEALRFVPRKHQTSFSSESRRTLWSIRPDLGNFVKVEELDIEQMMAEPEAEQLAGCAEELRSLPTNSYEISSGDRQSPVARWIQMANQLNEFNPIDSQLEQAKAKLSEQEYNEVLRSVAHLGTPLLLTESVRKDWLRYIEPSDYYWWLSLIKVTPAWQLSHELRPMRLAMFKQAEIAKAHEKWSEDEKKLSAKRILIGLRSVLKSPNTSRDSEAA